MAERARISKPAAGAEMWMGETEAVVVVVGFDGGATVDGADYFLYGSHGNKDSTSSSDIGEGSSLMVHVIDSNF
jgi:hypothetical protein